ncbi:MAG: twitching motility protein PilT [Sporichthyaceae bacterium]
MTLILDSGALIALERNQRRSWVRLKAALAAGEEPVTHGGVVGQVWRATSRQARMATALAGVDVQPLDEQRGRAAGALLGRARMSDVVDAALVLLALDGDVIVTSDPDDIRRLVEAADLHVEIVAP